MPPQTMDEIEDESTPDEEYATPQSVHEAPTSEDEPPLTEGDLPPHQQGVKSGAQLFTLGDNSEKPHKPQTSGDNSVSSDVDMGEQPTDTTVNVAVPTPRASTPPPTVGGPPSDSRVLVSSSPAPVHTSTTSQPTRIDQEVAQLKTLIDEVSPIALHRLLRLEWRNFLFTPFDEEHLTYILRACLKNSTPAVLERSLRDTLANTGNRQSIVSNSLQYADAAQILSRVPQDIIDQVVAHRLRDAPARSIVNWLAEAGRLGYSKDDIINKDDESIRLNNSFTQTSQSPYHHAAYDRQQGLDHQNQIQPHLRPPAFDHHNGISNGTPPLSSTTGDAVNLPRDLTCPECGFQAQTQAGLSYHKDRTLCRREAPEKGWKASCSNCGQVFTQKQGHNYHVMKLVCYGGKLEGNITPEEHDAVRGRLGLPPLDRSPERTTSEPPTMLRPTFSTARPSTSQPESAQPPLPRQTPASAVQAHIQRPPMHTLVPPDAASQKSQMERAVNQSVTKPSLQAVQAIDPTARVSPSQLTPARKAEMERQIEAEDQRYQNALAAIDPQLPQADQDKRRISLKNGNATKKSQIRKSFGVTLRMRPKDKEASRIIASPSPVYDSRRRTSFSSPLVGSQVSTASSGFSPINAPAPHNSSLRFTPKSPAFKPVGIHVPQRQLPSRSVSHPLPEEMNPRTSPRPQISSFGFQTQSPLPEQPGGYRIPTHDPKPQAQSPHPPKRQRTSSGGEQERPALANFLPTTSPPPLERTHTPYGPTGGAGLSTMEVRSEDAASRYPKRVPVHAAQAKWEALQPTKNRKSGASGDTVLGKRKTSDVGTDGAMDIGKTGTRSLEEVIVIDSDTESGNTPDGRNGAVGRVEGTNVNGNGSGEVADADEPLPSTEDTESEASRPSSSAGGSAAKLKKQAGYSSQPLNENERLGA